MANFMNDVVEEFMHDFGSLIMMHVQSSWRLRKL